MWLVYAGQGYAHISVYRMRLVSLDFLVFFFRQAQSTPVAMNFSLQTHINTNDVKFEKRQIRHDTFIRRSMRYVSIHRIASSSSSLNSTVSPLRLLYLYAFEPTVGVCVLCMLYGECARHPIHIRFEQNRERGQRTNERVKKKKENILFFSFYRRCVAVLSHFISRTFIVYFSLSQFVKIGRQA